MQTEIEVKFLNIDHDNLRQKLKALGARCEQPMRLMRRQMFEYPDGSLAKKKGRLRVRDEGDKLTVTYKQGSDDAYSYEVETTIGSFEAMAKLFEAIGLVAYSLQESKRETWHLDDVEVVLDEWPWIKPYIEIEGPNEAAIQDAAQQLGFSWNDAVYGSVDKVYMSEYPKMTPKDTIGEVAYVLFADPIPSYLVERQ